MHHCRKEGFLSTGLYQEESSQQVEGSGYSTFHSNWVAISGVLCPSLGFLVRKKDWETEMSPVGNHWHGWRSEACDVWEEHEIPGIGDPGEGESDADPQLPDAPLGTTQRQTLLWCTTKNERQWTQAMARRILAGGGGGGDTTTAAGTGILLQRGGQALEEIPREVIVSPS